VSTVFTTGPLDAHDPDSYIYSIEVVNEFILVLPRAHKKQKVKKIKIEKNNFSKIPAHIFRIILWRTCYLGTVMSLHMILREYDIEATHC
jgi:hypothetical protein